MAVVYSNLTRLSRCKSLNYAQITRQYSNVKYVKSNNSLKLLGVLSSGVVALSYLKWQNKNVVVHAAFNPKKMKVGEDY